MKKLKLRKKVDYSYEPIAYEIKPRVPNCALCQWGVYGEGSKSYCCAQAMKSQKDVYCNDNCKDLYMLDILKQKEIMDKIDSEIPKTIIPEDLLK